MVYIDFQAYIILFNVWLADMFSKLHAASYRCCISALIVQDFYCDVMFLKLNY